MISGIRRSSLFVPGDSRKMILKSAGLAADVLLLNLEDGVSRSKKEEARNIIVEALQTVNFAGKETVVRVNSIQSETGMKDIAAVVPACPDGICLPKVESAQEVQAADTAVLEMELAAGLEEGRICFYVMIESAQGVLNAAGIASASPRMAALVFGSADYVKDIRCQPGEDRAELLLPLQQIVLAARAAGIDAIDAPCFDLQNQVLLRKEALQSRRLGFDGKNALHPDQIGPINEVFDVTPEEIAWAQNVLAELADAEGRGRALSTMDGRLIDNPHRALAERILSRAHLLKKESRIQNPESKE